MLEVHSKRNALCPKLERGDENSVEFTRRPRFVVAEPSETDDTEGLTFGLRTIA
jgi:hypothetical protein